MAEEAGERRMERPAFGLSPSTPTASSAGPTLAVQGNCASIDWNPKKSSISGTSAAPPRPAVSTSTAAVSSHRLLCRPWDCGDLLRRLSTFKISCWKPVPQAIAPAACARKGWINADVNTIACECCDRRLRLEVETSIEFFREQLDINHQASCPWKGNACSDFLAQFPSSLMALIGGYNDRRDALLQLHSLPVISALAIDQMRLSRGPQIDRLLSQPPIIPGMEFETRIGAEAFCKAQRIISFCGWEPRLLPNAADFEDHSAQSTRNACLIKTSHKRGKRSMPRPEKERNKGATTDLRYSPASTLLECTYCGANANVLRFQTVARPPIGGTSATDSPVLKDEVHTLVRGSSAASSIVRKRQLLEVGEGGEATTSEQKSLPVPKASVSNLISARVFRPSGPQQPECSEMGDCGAASYESRGPRDDQHGTGQGDSSPYMPQFRAESGGGTNGDCDADDEGKSCAAESSKRKRIPESLAADQHSYGVAVSGNATSEPDAEAEVVNDRKNKRVCIAPNAGSAAAFEQRISIEAPEYTRRRGLKMRQEDLRRRITGELPCSSSVNATDTCFQNKVENSMDSVEYMPQDDANQHTAASGYTENDWVFDEPNSGVQQQSTSDAQAHAQGTKSDTNAAVISTGTATAGGGSVGMTTKSQRVQSNEADIQGAEFSEHQTESVAGEAEVVIDPVDQGLVCDSTPLPVAAQDGNNGDSREAMLSLCPGAAAEQNSAKDVGDESGESGSKASLRPRNGFPEEERTIDTTNALIMGWSAGTITKEATDGSVEAAAAGEDERAVSNSALTAKEAEDIQHVAEFDPIRSHKSFCPWVNGLVLAATNGTFGESALCGWQLTVDALDAFQLQENIVGMTESESTASMCKDEASKRMFQGSSSQQCVGTGA